MISEGHKQKNQKHYGKTMISEGHGKKNQKHYGKTNTKHKKLKKHNMAQIRSGLSHLWHIIFFVFMFCFVFPQCFWFFCPRPSEIIVFLQCFVFFCRCSSETIVLPQCFWFFCLCPSEFIVFLLTLSFFACAHQNSLLSYRLFCLFEVFLCLLQFLVVIVREPLRFHCFPYKLFCFVSYTFFCFVFTIRTNC